MTRAEKDIKNAKERARYAAKHPNIPLVHLGKLIFIAMCYKRYVRRLEKQSAAARRRHAANNASINVQKRASYYRSKEANPEKMKARGRRLMAMKRATPQGKILNVLRSRIGHALKGVPKANRSIELLAMDLKEYRIYLQGQFLPGMTWENYGPVWHIDHIRPCASFDLTDPAQQRECFHWSNTQPLWARDNIIKGDSLENLRNTTVR